jgi:hypothetical protein
MFASYGQASIDRSQVLPSDWISIDHPILSLATIVTFQPIKSDRKLLIFSRLLLTSLVKISHRFSLLDPQSQNYQIKTLLHQAVTQAFKTKGD